ncbi:Ribonuclease Z [Gracilaria domingensis]|nr:Ribonuclease Z [Gracilaria domingensis]
MLSYYAVRASRRLSLRHQHFLHSRGPQITPNLFFNVRTKCSYLSEPLTPSGTGGFELTFLGTSSQGGARRYPSSLAVRLRGISSSEVWVFDAGEGAMAQLQRSNMRVGLVRNIFISHLHGDHLYGLPGLVMSILGRREVFNKQGETTLNVYGPQGIRGFLRMALGVASFRIPGKGALRINELIWPDDFGPRWLNNKHRNGSMYWKNSIRRLPFEMAGRDIVPDKDAQGRFTYEVTGEEEVHKDDKNSKRQWLGTGPATVVAAPVLHTVPSYAYGVTENVVSQRFDKGKLQELGIPTDGREEVRVLFEQWLSGERGIWQGKQIPIDEVLQNGRSPRTLCIIGDTYDASGAAHIAKGVDVLVHEATNMAAGTHTARSRGHSSTVGASSFARRVGARRLILNHASVSYSERKIRAMEVEARGMFGANKAFVARDLSVFNIPTCEEDDDDFGFRRFVGFADSLEFRSPEETPFTGDFVVESEEGSAQDEDFDSLKADEYSDEHDEEDACMLLDGREQATIGDELDIHSSMFREREKQPVLTM